MQKCEKLKQKENFTIFYSHFLIPNHKSFLFGNFRIRASEPLSPVQTITFDTRSVQNWLYGTGQYRGKKGFFSFIIGSLCAGLKSLSLLQTLSLSLTGPGNATFMLLPGEMHLGQALKNLTLLQNLDLNFIR